MRAERRSNTRWVPRDTHLVNARIKAGAPVKVLNCSHNGVQVATSMRLMPGRRCVMAWPSLEGSPLVAGAIVRCVVSALDPLAGVFYHAAVRFDTRATFIGETATHAG